MQGEFTIYPQKLKSAIEEYQAMSKTLQQAAERISDIQKDMDSNSFSDIKNTLLTIQETIAKDAGTLQKFETVLHDCVTEYTSTEVKLQDAISTITNTTDNNFINNSTDDTFTNTTDSDNTDTTDSDNTDTADSDNSDTTDSDDTAAAIQEKLRELLAALLAYQNAMGLLSAAVAPILKEFLETALGESVGTEAVETVLDSPFNQNSFFEDAATEGWSEAVKNEVLPYTASSAEISAADVYKEYVKEEVAQKMISLDLPFGDDSTAEIASADTADNYDTPSGDSSGGSGGSSGGSGASPGSSTSTGSGITKGSGSTAKWTGGSPVPTTAKELDNYGAYANRKTPSGTPASKVAAIPDASAAGAASNASPSSALSSKLAGSSILGIAALGTLGVISANWAYKSKNKNDEPCFQ